MAQARPLMSSVFHCIPGIELPVSEVVSSMAKMWESEPAKGHKPPSEFRASQMNLIVHLGYNTTTEEAKQLFRTANAFAHGYPSRIIILCPTPAEDADTLLMGKLYSECYIGQSMRDMRCCEILTLGYDENAPQYLENQVSVWLESDLPAYYWCHRLPSERLNTVYKDFLRFCKCKIYDSSVEGRQFRSQLKEPEIYRNLSYARLLPLRQSIGQVLSGFEPSCLVEGLESVTLSCSNAHYGEGGALSHWIYSCLEECAKIAGMKISFDLVDVSGGGTRDFDLKFHFSDNKQLQFLANIASGTASLHGEMGRGVFSYSLKSGLLSPEKALAEAIFFNN